MHSFLISLTANETSLSPKQYYWGRNRMKYVLWHGQVAPVCSYESYYSFNQYSRKNQLYYNWQFTVHLQVGVILEYSVFTFMRKSLNNLFVDAKTVQHQSLGYYILSIYYIEILKLSYNMISEEEQYWPEPSLNEPSSSRISNHQLW